MSAAKDDKIRELARAAEAATPRNEVRYDPAKYCAVVGERFAGALDTAIAMNERLATYIASGGFTEPDHVAFFAEFFGATTRLRDIWHLVRTPEVTQ